MSRKQVFYFYEGETEKKLLEFLKNTKKISSGKVRKFNLWKGRFRKIQRTIRDLCINRNNHQKPTFHPLGDFLNPALALLRQGLKKSPIG